MNKHRATFNDQVFTRNSKGRRYTHCVVARPSRERAAAYADSLHEVDAKNWEYYASPRAYANQGAYIGAGEVRVDDYLFRSAEEFTSVFPSAAAFQRYERDRRVAKFEQREAEGEFDTHVDQGWCGRPDLAEKLRAKTAASGYWVDVRVLEAEIL